MIIGTPYTKGAGYFVNDKDLKTRQEGDVKTCTHCQAVIIMQQWKNDGAWCSKCFAPICARCGKIAETKGCEPFLKKIEQYAEQQMRFQKF
jgi:hypothetical protein